MYCIREHGVHVSIFSLYLRYLRDLNRPVGISLHEYGFRESTICIVADGDNCTNAPTLQTNTMQITNRSTNVTRQQTHVSYHHCSHALQQQQQLGCVTCPLPSFAHAPLTTAAALPAQHRDTWSSSVRAEPRALFPHAHAHAAAQTRRLSARMKCPPYSVVRTSTVPGATALATRACPSETCR